MFKGLGMLQVYNATCVFNINHDAESAVELRHGVGGGVPIVYHHHVLHISILGLYWYFIVVFYCLLLLCMVFCVSLSELVTCL